MSGSQEKKNILFCAQIVNLLIGINQRGRRNNFFKPNNSRLRYNADKDLYLYNKNQIDHFFKIIKPKNEKHVLKYEIFKKTGKILKTEELIDYMTHRWCNG